MDAWTRLPERLAAIAAQAPPPPAGGRQAAALALLADAGDGDLELVLTRRRDDLANHPGQISFPGGRVDAGETMEEAAVREAAEECGLLPSTVTVLGSLPAFYIPPSRFWLQVVVARWDAPHPLTPAEAEVAEILHVRTSALADPDRWRVVKLSSRGDSWAWDIGGGHILWGATGVATAVLLGLIDPSWSRGTDPATFMPDREVRPWEQPSTVAPTVRAARIPGVPERPRATVRGAPLGDVEPDAVRRAGTVAAGAVAGLRRDDAPVVVLCGPGYTGAVGLELAASLHASEVPVTALTVGGADTPLRADALRRLGDRVRPYSGALPDGGLVVDALVGRGLVGPLRGEVLDVVMALRAVTTPVVSIDAPTGLDNEEGIVGDAVSADVTLAVGAPADILFQPGVAPFVGDVYLVDLEPAPAGAADPIVRLVPGADDRRWSE